MGDFLNHVAVLPYTLYTVSLKQIVPSDGSLVCPGNPLVFECVTSTRRLMWQEGGKTATFFIQHMGASGATRRFQVEVIEVNGSVIVSTATIPEVRHSDTGRELHCMERIQPLTEVVNVPGKSL